MTHDASPKHTPPPKSPREYEARIRELEAAQVSSIVTNHVRRTLEIQNAQLESLCVEYIKATGDDPRNLQLVQQTLEGGLKTTWFIEPRPDAPKATNCNGTGQVAIEYGQRHCKGCANCGGDA